MALEPGVEPVFHEDSYGYRPGRSPVDAVAVCRGRCFKKNWVVDLDIRGFLTAALALQDYAARSAAWALTGATGQPLAEQIHAALREHPAGLTRSQISQTLNHNQPAGQIDHALHALHDAGRVTAAQIPTGGRPAQLWTATPPTGA